MVSGDVSEASQFSHKTKDEGQEKGQRTKDRRTNGQKGQKDKKEKRIKRTVGQKGQ